MSKLCSTFKRKCLCTISRVSFYFRKLLSLVLSFAMIYSVIMIFKHFFHIFFSHNGAMRALKMFNGRWYAGRQLSVELSPVTNWKSSICGEFILYLEIIFFMLIIFHSVIIILILNFKICIISVRII